MELGARTFSFIQAFIHSVKEEVVLGHFLLVCFQTLELDLSSSPVASLVSVTNAEGSLVRMRPPPSSSVCMYVYSPDGAWSESDGVR